MSNVGVVVRHNISVLLMLLFSVGYLSSCAMKPTAIEGATATSNPTGPANAAAIAAASGDRGTSMIRFP